VKIDREIEAAPPEVERQPQIVTEPARRIGCGRDDDLIEVRIVPDDWRRQRLDEVRQARIGKRLSNSADRRRRQDDVANQAKADEKDS